jgi:hypothetical protein
MRTSQKTAGIITTIGIDLGKNTFHLVGFDQLLFARRTERPMRNNKKERILILMMDTAGGATKIVARDFVHGRPWSAAKA